MYKLQKISRLHLPWSCKLLVTLAFLLCSTAYAKDYQTNESALAHQEVPYSDAIRNHILSNGEPRVEKITDRVYVARAYDWSNHMYVVGDDGIIVVDTGFHEESSARALVDFRKKAKTDKPIVAVIYTHGHPDHTGGVRAFIPEGEEKNIALYAASNWTEYQDNQISPNFLWVRNRGEHQYDLDRVFDEGKEMASIFGPFPNSYAGKVGYVEPNHEIDINGGLHELTISGVRMKLFPMDAELLDTLMISLPDDKVLHAADNLTDTNPPIFTPRVRGDRDPTGIIRANDYMISLIETGEVEHLVMGHGDVHSSKPKKLKEKVKNYRDSIQTVLDQVVYFTGKGYSMDEVAERVRLPEHLNKIPGLGKFLHHPLEWSVRQAYVTKSGWWSGNPRDMIKPLPTEHAQLMIELVGSPAKMLNKAQQALEKGQNGWAVQLADYLLTVDKLTDEAKKVQVKAYLAQTAITESGMEYNYYLTRVKDLEGRFHSGGSKKLYAVEQIPRRSDAKDMIEVFIARFDMAKGEFENLAVNFNITETKETFGVHIDRGVLVRQPKPFDNAEGEVTLNKVQLFLLVSGVKTPEALNLNVKGDQARITQFFRILGL